jgi:hypothetical protein
MKSLKDEFHKEYKRDMVDLRPRRDSCTAAKQAAAVGFQTLISKNYQLQHTHLVAKLLRAPVSDWKNETWYSSLPPVYCQKLTK